MTDHKQLCAELVDVLAQYVNLPDDPEAVALLRRARAALTEPKPEGPTDQEIGEWADACSEAPLEELDPEVHGWRRCFTAQEFSETIRAALARWGRPAPQPMPVSERLPGPGDCDEQGRCWFGAPDRPGAVACWDLECEPATDDTHWLPAHALPLPATSRSNFDD